MMTRKSDDWSYCPACGGEIDTGYECNKCGRDWLEWHQTRDEQRAEIARLQEGKDAAYLERNQVVAALAKCFPSGVTRTAIEGWDVEWHGCIYIDLPTGQVSWHYHDSHAHLFEGLPPYTKPWDGHSTEEKYNRLAQIKGSDLARVMGEAVWAMETFHACTDQDDPSWHRAHQFLTSPDVQAWRKRQQEGER